MSKRTLRACIQCGRPSQNAIRAFVATIIHCALCGQGPRPNDPFVCDHIIPRAHGGTDDPTNWQGAHRSCNGRKGARIGNEGHWSR